MTTAHGTRLGIYVRTLRRARRRPDGDRWSQEDLAREAGVSTSTVARLEQGRTIPQRDVLRRIAEALDTTPDELLTAALAPPAPEPPRLTVAREVYPGAADEVMALLGQLPEPKRRWLLRVMREFAELENSDPELVRAN